MANGATAVDQVERRWNDTGGGGGSTNSCSRGRGVLGVLERWLLPGKAPRQQGGCPAGRPLSHPAPLGDCPLFPLGNIAAAAAAARVPPTQQAVRRPMPFQTPSKYAADKDAHQLAAGTRPPTPSLRWGRGLAAGQEGGGSFITAVTHRVDTHLTRRRRVRRRQHRRRVRVTAAIPDPATLDTSCMRPSPHFDGGFCGAKACA